MMNTARYFATASLTALLIASPAYAQDAPENSETEMQNNEIIVTATKREQTLQETPVAVSVTSAATIEQAQIRDLLDLQTIVPTLRVSQVQSSANTNFYIRGFGNGANNAGIEPSVGVFIDGVYRSRSAAQIGDLPDVQRIEVLRGPQSTLFGKNASAGVVSLITRKPQFTFGGSAELSYGNYDAIVAKASITGPISDTIAFSLAGNYNKRDGYGRDINLNSDVNNRNRYGGRAQILFEPTSDLSIRIIGDYDKVDEVCCGVTNFLAGPTAPLLNFLAGGSAFPVGDPLKLRVSNNFESTNKIDNYGVSGQVDYDFGSIDLTSITAYRGSELVGNQDSDFSKVDLLGRNSSDTNIKTFTQELRLASDFDGPLNFLLGGYYFNERVDQTGNLVFGTQFRPYGNALIQGATGGALDVPTLEAVFGALDGTSYAGQFFQTGRGVNDAYKLRNTAWSIFGNVDFEVTDRLTLTAGFNYTQDRKRLATNNVSTDTFSRLNLDAAQYAPFRNQLLVGGALAQGASLAQAQAFANANQNNPAANPLAGLRAFQFLPPFLNIPNAVESGKTSDNDLSWTVRAAYELSDGINLYATYATGFKASSINLSRDSRPSPADFAIIRATPGLATPNLTTGSRSALPEEAEVYEVGIKGSFPRVSFNLAVFQQAITGFQSNVFTGTGFALANAGKQSTFGFEFDGSVTPVDPLTIFLAVTYLDPKYDSFVNSAVGDQSGRTPAGIPPLSVAAGATLTKEFASGTKVILRGDYFYEADVQVSEGLPAFGANAIAAAQPFVRKVGQLSASATLALSNGLELSVWGRNLTNNIFINTVFDSVVQQGSISGYPSQPRTYGASVRYKF
jgi:iron complex outermembrane recepter protein